MKKYQHSCLVLALVAAAWLSLAQPGQKGKSDSASAQASHVMVMPDQVKWGPGPPALPAGSQLAVLEGDPTKAGAPFTMRGKMPDGYKIPPHWHPTDEKIVVLQGTLGIGMGDKFDMLAGHELPVGSFTIMPKGMRHYAWAKGETVIQVSGIGPFEVTYVNPADDPRKAK